MEQNVVKQEKTDSAIEQKGKQKPTAARICVHVAQLLLGACILAFGMYNVHSRCAVTEGGVLGMTLLLHHWLHISPSISGFLMDATCYFLGWRVLGRGFLKDSLIASAGFSLFYRLFEAIGPVLPSLRAYPLAAAIVGALFVGVGVGIVVRAGGAAGGDDALALVICKTCKCRISLAYLATDLTVLLLSLSYIPFKRIFFSLITVTLSSFLIDRIQRCRLPVQRKGTREVHAGETA